MFKKLFVAFWVKPWLRRRFARMQKAGCVDFKVSLYGTTPLVADDVYLELYRMYKALDAGTCTPLSFNDSWSTKPAS
jgi:hypothetical protein